MDTAALCKTALFRGSSPEEVEAMLACLGAERRQYAKGEMVCRVGDVISSMGVVLRGSLLIQTDDLWGNTAVLDRVGLGQIFGEAYACALGEPLMVDVVATDGSEVLFLNVERVLNVCSNVCGHHNRLVRNLLSISAQKNLALSRKIFHTSSKTIRGRLLSYLSDQAVRSGSSTFTIPFNRQQLADYLNVDRSAMSNELGKMQRDNLLRVEKNRFQLLEQEKK